MKTEQKELVYLAPQVQVDEIKVECNILADSHNVTEGEVGEEDGE